MPKATSNMVRSCKNQIDKQPKTLAGLAGPESLTVSFSLI